MVKIKVSIALVLMLIAGAAFADPPGWQVRTLTHGAEVQGTNGLAVGADGYLYIGSVVSRQIVIMNPRTGAVVDRLGRELGIETPDDVAFGPDGSLYWTSIFTGEVGRLRPDGTSSTIAQLPPGANPIAFDALGRLFVGLAAFGDALYELDPEGVDAPRLILDQPGGLNGFAFGPDGLLYSPLTAAQAVVRIDVDAATVETVATGFPDPVAVDFDSLGRLHVADSATGEIGRIDPVTGDVEVFVTLRPGLDNLAFDARDRLYVTSVHDGSVKRIRPDGRVRTISAGGMITAGGVAVLPLGPHGRRDEVWVADFFTLRSFSGVSGRPLAVERSKFDASALTAPHTVAADGDRLLMTSWLFNNVQVFDPVTGEISLDVRDFALPLNAIRFQGDLVVAELLSGSVVRADGVDPSQRTVLASGLAVPSAWRPMATICGPPIGRPVSCCSWSLPAKFSIHHRLWLRGWRCPKEWSCCPPAIWPWWNLAPAGCRGSTQRPEGSRRSPRGSASARSRLHWCRRPGCSTASRWVRGVIFTSPAIRPTSSTSCVVVTTEARATALYNHKG